LGDYKGVLPFIVFIMGFAINYNLRYLSLGVKCVLGSASRERRRRKEKEVGEEAKEFISLISHLSP